MVWTLDRGKNPLLLSGIIRPSSSPVALFRSSCRSLDNVEKNGRAGEARDDNMAHAHCMLDK